MEKTLDKLIIARPITIQYTWYKWFMLQFSSNKNQDDDTCVPHDDDTGAYKPLEYKWNDLTC